MKYTFALTLLNLCASIAFGKWQEQAVETKSDFRGLCVVSAKVVWAGGTKGTFARTTDGGKTWAVATVPGADKLDFREVSRRFRRPAVSSAGRVRDPRPTRRRSSEVRPP